MCIQALCGWSGALKLTFDCGRHISIRAGSAPLTPNSALPGKQGDSTSDTATDQSLGAAAQAVPTPRKQHEDDMATYDDDRILDMFLTHATYRPMDEEEDDVDAMEQQDEEDEEDDAPEQSMHRGGVRGSAVEAKNLPDLNDHHVCCGIFTC